MRRDMTCNGLARTSKVNCDGPGAGGANRRKASE